MATPKKHYAARDFRDAGTEKVFALGDELTGEQGLDNYVAAGLATDEKPQAAKTDATPST